MDEQSTLDRTSLGSEVPSAFQLYHLSWPWGIPPVWETGPCMGRVTQLPIGGRLLQAEANFTHCSALQNILEASSSHHYTGSTSLLLGIPPVCKTVAGPPIAMKLASISRGLQCIGGRRLTSLHCKVF